MDDNNLLMIILAFVIGYCLQGMMKNMCGGRLIEGSLTSGWDFCTDGSCPNGQLCSGKFISLKKPNGTCVDKLSCNKKIPAIGCFEDTVTTPKDTNSQDIVTSAPGGMIGRNIERGSPVEKSTNTECQCPGDTSRGTGTCNYVSGASSGPLDDWGCVCPLPKSTTWDACQTITQKDYKSG